MRWDALFADMELQMEAASAQGRAQEVAELTRAERASVHLADRLRAGVGAALRVRVRTGESVTGVVRDVGPVWMLLAESGREHLLPLHAVVTVAGLTDVAAPDVGPVLRRLGLGHVLRAVARDRSVVQVVTMGGTLVGRIDAVGADHLDVALVYPDSGRPTGELVAVALAGLEVLSSL